MTEAGRPTIPVSWGELLDKLSILEIKRQRIACGTARANVEKEYRLLRVAAAEAVERPGVETLFQRLSRINAALWDIEDAIRELEASAEFGTAFVTLARRVYMTNDDRAGVKRAINQLLQSDLVEEKSYAGHSASETVQPLHSADGKLFGT